MTLSSITPLITYTATNGQTDFPLPNQYYDAADVKVWLVVAAVETPQVLGVNFNVIQTGGESVQPGLKTGIARMAVPRTAGETVVVGIWPKADQDQRYHGVPITARQRERVVDRLAMRDAFMRELTTRTIRQPLSEPAAARTLEVGAPGTVPMFDANGNLVEGPTAGSIAAAVDAAINAANVASASASSAAASQASASGSATSSEYWAGQSEYWAGQAEAIAGGSAPPTDDSVTRPKVAPVLRDYGSLPVNIREYGTNGAAFTAAHAAVPAGHPIIVPAGTYALGGDITMTGRHVILLGTVTFTGGALIGAVEERHDPTVGTTRLGSGVQKPGAPHQADHHIGDTLNNIVRRGLVIGGGDPRNGTDGTRFSLDSYPGWVVAQNTKYGGAQEWAFQPNAISGIASRTIGGNTFTTTYPMFDASHVGKLFYFSTGEIYRISAVNSSTNITVTEQGGGAVAFANTKTDACMMVWVGGSGTGVMSGDTLDRLSGDPFVVKGISTYFFRINGGTIYEANVWIDPSTITLTGAAFANGTPVTYEFWTTINHLSSRVVVQRGNGLGGAEELVSLESYADGKFKLQALSSVGTFPFAASQRPFHIGNGYSAGGGERTQILLDGVLGDTFMGGAYEAAAVRVTSREGVAGNRIRLSGADIGAPPEISAEGLAADVDLVVTAQGAGMVRIGGSIDGVVTTGSEQRVLFVKDYAGNVLKINAWVP